METSSFRMQFGFLSVDLNLLRRWNVGLWLVTYFPLMMKVREKGRKNERGREWKEPKAEGKRGREQARVPQRITEGKDVKGSE